MAELTPGQLAKEPAGFQNSIATLVVHIGAAEIHYAHHLMGIEVPADLEREYLMHQYRPLPAHLGPDHEGVRFVLSLHRPGFRAGEKASFFLVGLPQSASNEKRTAAQAVRFLLCHHPDPDQLQPQVEDPQQEATQLGLVGHRSRQRRLAAWFVDHGHPREEAGQLRTQVPLHPYLALPRHYAATARVRRNGSWSRNR